MDKNSEKEVDGLAQKGAIVKLSPNKVREWIKQNPTAKVIPSKGVFTIKVPDTFKVRGVACGNKVEVTGLDIYASGVEAASLRLLLTIAAESDWDLSAIDVAQAFLNAELNLPYKIALWPPKVFCDAGLCEVGELWLVERAIYGLRESPKCWGDNRDAELRAIRIIYEGSPTRFTQSRTDPNMWKIVKRPTDVLKFKVPVCIRVRIAAFTEPAIQLV